MRLRNRIYKLPPNKFQSTHPHGVRLIMVYFLVTLSCFNPRTHTGCDPYASAKGAHQEGVSIHAPTRGATDVLQVRSRHRDVSIHAPTRGATIYDIVAICHLLFQSTHPHGVRPSRGALHGLGGQFQSTHPHGVRPPVRLRRYASGRFQSTHPHGVRRQYGVLPSDAIMFQSTHPHGVRP